MKMHREQMTARSYTGLSELTPVSNVGDTCDKQTEWIGLEEWVVDISHWGIDPREQGALSTYATVSK